MFVQLRRILFATDFSDPANKAFEYAIALGEQFGCELHLLHIVPKITMPLPDSTNTWTLPASEQKLELEEAQSRLRKVIGSEWKGEYRVVEVARVGDPVEEIVKYAKEQEIDLIVLGTHGHTGFAHLLLGSVTEKVVRLAMCPVLTVHPQGHQFLCKPAKEESTTA